MQSPSGSGVVFSPSSLNSFPDTQTARTGTALSPRRLPLSRRRGLPTLALGVFQKLVDIPRQRDDLRLWKTEAECGSATRSCTRPEAGSAHAKRTYAFELLNRGTNGTSAYT